eukprot:173080-Chlamydomonas_euryale.AAC.3
MADVADVVGPSLAAAPAAGPSGPAAVEASPSTEAGSDAGEEYHDGAGPSAEASAIAAELFASSMRSGVGHGRTEPDDGAGEPTASDSEEGTDTDDEGMLIREVRMAGILTLIVRSRRLPRPTCGATTCTCMAPPDMWTSSRMSKSRTDHMASWLPWPNMQP